MTIASPCPTSHAAIAHPSGTACGAIIVRTATRPSPDAIVAATVVAANKRHRVSFDNRATIAAAVTTASRMAPPMPSGHAMRPLGTRVATSATVAIHVAGTHAIAASARPTNGTMASRHAIRPMTVAIGAAGAAMRLASVPMREMCGSMRMMMGAHAS
ncbi:hypothetical protein GCM10009860_16480 [Microbacterium mitrae]